MKFNYESAMFFCVSSRASFAYSRYWLHKQQMVMQFDRVQAALHEKSLCNEWLKEPDISQPDANRLWFHFKGIINKKVLAEVHLLFIAIDNAKDMMNVILSEEKLVHLKRKLGSFYNSLERYTEGRNIFEHYDQRIPGGNRHEKVSEEKGKDGAGARRNLGGLRGNSYTFGGKEWDLSNIAMQPIINGMGSFEKEIHEYLELNQKST